jgi:DNA-binding MarR family transcriptional regulator
MAHLTERHFTGLLAVRSGIAAFERTSEREARLVGATHAQQHVMLSLRGHGDPAGPTVKDVAGALGVSSPSAVELIARMVGAGLLERHNDPSDARVTRLKLTTLGLRLLHQLSENHLPRLRDLTSRWVEHLAE